MFATAFFKFSLAAILATGLSHSAHAVVTYGLGTSWSIGYGTNASIAFASTTLNPGTPPTSQQGELVLWPGVSNGERRGFLNVDIH